MSGIAVFGGTFDPPHKGHLRLLKTADEKLHFEKIFVIPTNIPPHKQTKELADGRRRMELCRIIFGGDQRLTISDIELKREGKSYSYDTVKYLRGLFPDKTLYFIMGSDMLLTFDKWYKSEELEKMIVPVCLSRSNGDTALARRAAKRFNAVFIEASPFEISSTELRKAAARRDTGTLKKYLGEEAAEFIIKEKLYGLRLE